MSVKIFSANDWENWIKNKLVSEDERLIPNKNSIVCKGCDAPKTTEEEHGEEEEEVVLQGEADVIDEDIDPPDDELLQEEGGHWEGDQWVGGDEEYVVFRGGRF